jgi:hypothetical protein
VATRTHCAHRYFAPLAKISLCALLISRPTYFMVNELPYCFCMRNESAILVFKRRITKNLSRNVIRNAYLFLNLLDQTCACLCFKVNRSHPDVLQSIKLLKYKTQYVNTSIDHTGSLHVSTLIGSSSGLLFESYRQNAAYIIGMFMLLVPQ